MESLDIANVGKFRYFSKLRTLNHSSLTSYNFAFISCNKSWKKNEDCKSHKKICVQKILRTQKKFHIHEISAINLSKIYFLKNAKKTCKPNNHDFNDWIIKTISQLMGKPKLAQLVATENGIMRKKWPKIR